MTFQATGLTSAASGLTFSLSHPPAVAQAANGDTFLLEVDASGVVWMNHFTFAGSVWSGWQSPGGALVPNSAMTVTVGGGYFYTIPFAEATQSFGSWVYTGKVLTDESVTSRNADIYIAGRDTSDAIWWYNLNANTWLSTGGQSPVMPLTAGVTTPDSFTLSLNAGANSGETPATVQVQFSLTYDDETYGANDVAYAQFYLADSSGNAHCLGGLGAAERAGPLRRQQRGNQRFQR